MSKDFSRKFYSSNAWNNCRSSYMEHVHHLCERCLSRGDIVPGLIVHHKCYLTPENITDPATTLSFDNLELLCLDCHNKEHISKKPQRYTIDANGKVIIKN